MRKNLALFSVMLASAAVAAPGASKFTLVNGTNAALSQLSITRSGTQDWKPLANAPAPGGSSAIDYQNPDCAFDIRATVAGKGPVTWSGVNLCDVKSVILKRSESAGAWVDYDQ